MAAWPVAQRDAGFAQAPHQDGFNGVAGAVAAGMQDARARVRALAAEGDGALGGVEGDSEFGEAADPVGRFPYENLDGGAVAEAGAGGQGVGQVLLDAVVRAHGGGDAALGVLGVGFLDGALGDDDRAAVPGGEQGGVEPGDARAQDAVVVVGGSWGRSR